MPTSLSKFISSDVSVLQKHYIREKWTTKITKHIVETWNKKYTFPLNLKIHTPNDQLQSRFTHTCSKCCVTGPAIISPNKIKIYNIRLTKHIASKINLTYKMNTLNTPSQSGSGERFGLECLESSGHSSDLFPWLCSGPESGLSCGHGAFS